MFGRGITALTISELVGKLSAQGISLYKTQTGEVRIKTTGPAPPEARPLLAELKRRKAEVITCLQRLEPFDPAQGKVWRLTGTQAQELEALFAGPDVVERKGSRWYTIEKWLAKER